MIFVPSFLPRKNISSFPINLDHIDLLSLPMRYTYSLRKGKKVT